MAASISVIVPTRNRGALLADAVRSIAPQALADGAAEVLVVDTASTDDTPAVAEALRRELPVVRALRCDDPGLLAGRHLGAAEARGGVLVFVDDDVVAEPGWLAAYRGAFRDEGVGIACGPCLPLWEGDVPWWVGLLREEVPGGGWALPALSLVDCGGGARGVGREVVYGCNFAVRRGLVRECGGFHPDAVPVDRLAFRGDGESALAAAVAASGRRLCHEPGARVRHRVPAGRLTTDYLLRRAFFQGVSDSYARMRAGEAPAAAAPSRDPAGGLAIRGLRALRAAGRQGPARWLAGRRLLRGIAAARAAGARWHREAVERDPVLRAWVLRTDYLDDARMPAPSRPVLQFPGGVMP